MSKQAQRTGFDPAPVDRNRRLCLDDELREKKKQQLGRGEDPKASDGPAPPDHTARPPAPHMARAVELRPATVLDRSGWSKSELEVDVGRYRSVPAGGQVDPLQSCGRSKLLLLVVPTRPIFAARSPS